MQSPAASSDVVNVQILATVTTFVRVSVLVLWITVSMGLKWFSCMDTYKFEADALLVAWSVRVCFVDLR